MPFKGEGPVHAPSSGCAVISFFLSFSLSVFIFVCFCYSSFFEEYVYNKPKDADKDGYAGQVAKGWISQASRQRMDKPDRPPKDG